MLQMGLVSGREFGREFEPATARRPRRVATVPVEARERPTRGLLSGAELRSGYVPRNVALDQALNRAVAALLLVVLSPILLVIVLLQKATSRGAVLYRGQRLGKERAPFDIFKFRTLESSAAQLTADRTLPRRNRAETPIGHYLRSSRLDELPQLLNILRGEMAFFGPRPIRPEMEEYYLLEAPGSEVRFRVRPGLVGLAQAITSHETSKAVRARFNGMCCRTPVNYAGMAGVVAYVGFCVVRRTWAALFEAGRDALSPTRGHRWLRSGFASPTRSRVEMQVGERRLVAALCGVSDEILQFVSTQPFPAGVGRLELLREVREGRTIRVTVTARIVDIVPLGIGQVGYAHFANYDLESDFASYKIDRYFIGSSVCFS